MTSPASSGLPLLDITGPRAISAAIQEATPSATRCRAERSVWFSCGTVQGCTSGGSGTGTSGHSSTRPASPARSAKCSSVASSATPFRAWSSANTASTSARTGWVERNDTSSFTSRQSLPEPWPPSARATG